MLNFDQVGKTLLKEWESDTHARYIYEQILSRPDVRIRMVLASHFGLPALSVCAKEIEEYCENTPGCTVDVTKDTIRQRIGAMVVPVLADLGYRPVKSGRKLAASLHLKYFKTASLYEKQPDAKLVLTLRPGGTADTEGAPLSWTLE